MSYGGVHTACELCRLPTGQVPATWYGDMHIGIRRPSVA